MVRSFSKRDSRTHWWNLTSSITTDLPLSPANDQEEEYKNDWLLFVQVTPRPAPITGDGGVAGQICEKWECSAEHLVRFSIYINNRNQVNVILSNNV